MKIRKGATSAVEKIELNMTPMIDVVFQLLAFFVMTFKIATQEGDFSITMPIKAPSTQTDSDNLIVRVRLTSGPSGELTGIYWEDQPVDSFNALNLRVAQAVETGIFDDKGASNVEVELDCDPDLHYQHTVDAITAVSGRVDPDTGAQVKLCEKLRFAAPRGAGAEVVP